MALITRRNFIGWPASVLLLLLNVTSEFICVHLGRDAGPFLWVTVHFILMPLLSIALIVLIFIRTFRTPGVYRKLLVFSAASIPCLILLITARADLGFSRYLGNFR